MLCLWKIFFRKKFSKHSNVSYKELKKAFSVDSVLIIGSGRSNSELLSLLDVKKFNTLVFINHSIFPYIRNLKNLSRNYKLVWLTGDIGRLKEIYKYHKDFIYFLNARIHIGTAPWNFFQNYLHKRKNIVWCNYIEPSNIIFRKPNVPKILSFFLPGYPDLMIRSLEEYKKSSKESIKSKKFKIPSTPHATLFSAITIATKFVKNSISIIGCELSSNYSKNIPTELVNKSSFSFDDTNYCSISKIYSQTILNINEQKKIFRNYSSASPVKNDKYLSNFSN